MTESADARRLMVYESPDKTDTRPSWPGEGSVTLPARVLYAGPPGVGKRNMILNFVFRMDPPPTAIHVVHYEPTTREYEILETLGVPMYYYGADDFPTFDNLEDPDSAGIGDTAAGAPAAGDKEEGETPQIMPSGPQAPLVIIDELTTEQLGKEGAARMERLMNYGSSHKNTTVLCSIQAVTNLPPRSRRGFNQFCLWPQNDMSATDMAATRCGVPPALLRELLQLCHGRHDSIWVDTDRSPDSPWRFRLNMLTPIRATEMVRPTRDYAE